MRAAKLPLVPAEPPYLVCVPRGDGTADLYDLGDTLPDGMSPVRHTLADIVQAIDVRANSLREVVVGGATLAEMVSWPVKLAEASAYLVAPSPTAAPMLAAEAAARGVPLETIVRRVLHNSAALSAAEAAIAGVAGRHKDAVRAATDPTTYDWHTGWPDIRG